MHNHAGTIDTLRELAQAKVGSSHNQRLALLAIAEAESVQMGYVADRVGLSRGAMTTIVDGLVTKKLVRRNHDHGGDRRATMLEPTAAARRAIERAEAKAGLEALA